MSTLHLTTASRLAAWGGTGRIFAAMAAPPVWLRELGAIHRPDLAPDLANLRKMQGALRRFKQTALTADQLDACLAWYRRGYVGKLERLVLSGSAAQRAGHAIDGLDHGDTLTCTCAAPWDADLCRQPRRNPCHLELLAAELDGWGYRVVLHGRDDWPRDLSGMGWPPADLRRPGRAP